MFELLDLFAFGVGCDTAGAYLLGRGLIRSPRAIKRRSTYGGIYPGGLIDDVEDWAHATVGLAALVVGFTVQAAAYVLVGGIESSSATTVESAAGAAVAALFPAVAIVLGARITHRRRVDRRLVRAAREDVSANATKAIPDIEMLTRIAEYRGCQRILDESDDHYVQRVFGLARAGPPT